MLDNILQRYKMVSVGEKLVSNFEHFPSTHPPPLQTPFRLYRCVDICQTINIFLHHPSRCNLWQPPSGELDGAKTEKTLTILLIISIFLCVSGSVFPAQSEAGRSRGSPSARPTTAVWTAVRLQLRDIKKRLFMSLFMWSWAESNRRPNK